MKNISYRFAALVFSILLAASLVAQQPVRVTSIVALATGSNVIGAVTQSGTWTVTGSGGTFPVTGTFWQATQPVSGTFWQATQPVSGTFWQATQPVSATNLDVQIGGSDSLTIGTFPDNEPFNQALVGGTAVVPNPCEREAPLYIVIDQTSGEQLITGTASERIYICSIQLVTATAQNISLVSGTGTVCATSTGPLMGGTTAATGWNFGANGGLAMGNGSGSLSQTDTNADNVCLLQSGAGQVSGSVSYVSL